MVDNKSLIFKNAAEQFKALNDRDGEHGHLHSVFQATADILPRVITPADLVLAFRTVLTHIKLDYELGVAEIPAALSNACDGMSHEFFWQFRCEFGFTVLGLRPPYEDNKEDFGAPIFKGRDASCIDISKKDPAAVLAALYNYAWPTGMGFQQYNGAHLPVEAARQGILKNGRYFDYLAGRMMKLNIGDKFVNIGSYNWNNGRGIAERAIRTVQNIR